MSTMMAEEKTTGIADSNTDSNDSTSNNNENSSSTAAVTTNDSTDDNNTAAKSADESTVLFGSAPFDVMSELSDRIDNALMDGVASLPLLPKAPLPNSSSNITEQEEGGDEKLMKLLRKAYFKNVDIVEAYATRNIFSIQNFPPTRRRNIMEAFISKTIPTIQDTKENEKENKKKNDVDASQYKYPSKDEIPRKGELQKINQETQELREKLRQLRRHHTKVMKQLDSLSNVNQSVKVTNKVLQDVSTNHPNFQSRNHVHDSVTAMMVGKEGLEQLKRDGKDLSQKLDDKKRERSQGSEDDEEDFVDLQATAYHSNKNKLTLEEEYAERRKMIKTTKEGMTKMTEFLLKQR